jgi:hypothetical protein
MLSTALQHWAPALVGVSQRYFIEGVATAGLKG